MPNNKLKTERIDVRVPTPFLKKVEEYQLEQSIATRTQALLELARYGLEARRKQD
ncbi:hypothetical protein [Caldalkalibacillus salinus]|uniref:hypothetical protein n=1 Tax=Caldalkalibacillus salinus TaxID=2803787 RepID=UPI001925066C|nr:hypothetical protein [Caldalkalibacillus salinus]